MIIVLNTMYLYTHAFVASNPQSSLLRVWHLGERLVLFLAILVLRAKFADVSGTD
jgi:hypothetical protein